MAADTAGSSVNDLIADPELLPPNNHHGKQLDVSSCSSLLLISFHIGCKNKWIAGAACARLIMRPQNTCRDLTSVVSTDINKSTSAIARACFAAGILNASRSESIISPRNVSCRVGTSCDFARFNVKPQCANSAQTIQAVAFPRSDFCNATSPLKSSNVWGCLPSARS